MIKYLQGIADSKAKIPKHIIDKGPQYTYDWNTKPDSSGEVYHEGQEIVLRVNQDLDLYQVDISQYPLVNGPYFNQKARELSGTSSDEADLKIAAILFSNSEPNVSNNAIIVSHGECSNPLYMWYEYGIIYLYSNIHNAIFDDLNSVCYNLQRLTNISAFSNFITELEDTNAEDLFNNCKCIDDFSYISNFDMSKVTSINRMFSNCTFKTTESLNNLRFPNVTSANNLFSNNVNLVDASGLDNCGFYLEDGIVYNENGQEVSINNIFDGCNNIEVYPSWYIPHNEIEEDNILSGTCKLITGTEINNIIGNNKSNIYSIVSVSDDRYKNMWNLNEYFSYNTETYGSDFSDYFTKIDNGFIATTRAWAELYNKFIMSAKENTIYTLSFNYRWIEYDDPGTVMYGSIHYTDDTSTHFSINVTQESGTITIFSDYDKTINHIIFGGWGYNGTIEITNICIIEGELYPTIISTPDSAKECIIHYSDNTLYVYSNNALTFICANPSNMFKDCTNLSNIEFFSEPNFVLSGSMSSMFENCTSLSDISPLSNFNVTEVTNASKVFYNTIVSDASPLMNWKMLKVNSLENFLNVITLNLSTLYHLDKWMFNSGFTRIIDPYDIKGNTIIKNSVNSNINISNAFYSTLCEYIIIDRFVLTNPTNLDFQYGNEEPIPENVMYYPVWYPLFIDYAKFIG